MANFNPTNSFLQNNQCKDLVIFDTSLYGGNFESKSQFTGRSVKLTRFDGFVTNIPWVYSGSMDTVQDQLTISDYFIQDYGVKIEVTYIYTDSDTLLTVTKTYKEDVLFTCFVDVCYAKKALASSCSNCGCSDQSASMCKINEALYAAERFVKFGDYLKAQEFLQYASDLCNCGCSGGCSCSK